MGDKENWRDQVFTKLGEVFGNDYESFVRVQFYLDEEEKAYRNNEPNAEQVLPPSLRTLKLSLNNSKMFKTYASRLAEDTKTAEKDVQFKRNMDLLWSRIVEPSEEEFDETNHQSFDLAKLADSEKTKSFLSLGFIRAWDVMEPIHRQGVLSTIRQVVTNRSVLNSVDEVVGLYNKGGGSVVMVTLAAVTLAWDVYKNILRWWAGEITGVRCIKNIVDSGLCIGAGLGGGVAGAAVGSLAGPLGTAVGGIVGGFVAGKAASLLVDRLTQWIFGLPQSEALENAYKYLGVSMNASNNEVNTAFRHKCLKHHPDKGGREEDFLFLQYNMATIKAARGELY